MATITAKYEDESMKFPIQLSLLELHSPYFRRLFDGLWSDAHARRSVASQAATKYSTETAISQHWKIMCRRKVERVFA